MLRKKKLWGASFKNCDTFQFTAWEFPSTFGVFSLTNKASELWYIEKRKHVFRLKNKFQDIAVLQGSNVQSLF